jgi:hypothetical protein
MSTDSPVAGIDFPLEGTIVTGAALDSLSTRNEISAQYPPYPILGAANYPTELKTLRTGATKEAPTGVPMLIVNPDRPPLPAPGTWPNILPPLPPPLERLNILGKVNTTVFFEGKRVVVSGDTVNAPSGTPKLRDLTGTTPYPTIIIGTQT